MGSVFIMLEGIFQPGPLLALFQAGGGSVIDLVVKLLIQLAVILFAAKVAGELATRFLKLPSVLAELGAGILIGPYVLGGMAFFGWAPLFPGAFEDPTYGPLSLGGLSLPFIHTVQNGVAIPGIPVSDELYALAQIGSIVLLFSIGLETNLRQFIRYAGPATAVALGGVILPFALGVGATVFLGFAGPEGFFSPEALFMGAIMTATSVGITARVLADLHSLDNPEGVTIIAAAVVDDVLGILILTVVIGISASEANFTWGSLGWISFKAVGFWLGLTGIGILVAPYIERLVRQFHSPGSGLVFTLALALLAAGLAEVFGLAFIIGAFSVGLALSTTSLGHQVEEAMTSILDFLVPVFFVVMGMLVDIGAMQNAIVFGLVISVLAILSKVLGSGGPALFTGFNLRGGARIGVGMMPRGEVALIIAGVGLTEGIIGHDLFGVSIMMTVLTTLLAPMLLVPLFRKGGRGTTRPQELEAGAAAADD